MDQLKELRGTIQRFADDDIKVNVCNCGEWDGGRIVGHHYRVTVTLDDGYVMDNNNCKTVMEVNQFLRSVNRTLFG